MAGPGAADDDEGRAAGKAWFRVRSGNAVQIVAAAVERVEALPDGGTRIWAGEYRLDLLDDPSAVLRALCSARAPGAPAPVFVRRDPGPASPPPLRVFLARCRRCRAWATTSLHHDGAVTWRPWAGQCRHPTDCDPGLPVAEDQRGERPDLFDPRRPGVL